MFTDMVGFTSLGQKYEAQALALAEEMKKLVRPRLEQHGGHPP